MTITYRQANGDDAQACNDFGNRIRAQERKLGAWHWEFSNAPDGNAPFVIALDGSRIIGTLAGIPMTMRSGSQVIRSAKIEEALVDPEYRGHGVFDGIYNLLQRLLVDREIELSWGFTSAIRPFARIGFGIHPVVSHLYFPLALQGEGLSSHEMRPHSPASLLKSFAVNGGTGLSSLAGKAAALTWLPKVEGVAEAGWTNRNLSLVNSIVAQHELLSLQRDPEFMTWRLEDNPYAKPTLLTHESNSSYVIVAMGQHGVCQVVDLMADPSDLRTIGALLAAALAWARQHSARLLRVMSVGGDPVSKGVKRAAIALGAIPWPLRNKGTMVIRWDRMPEVPVSRWYVTSLYTEGYNG